MRCAAVAGAYEPLSDRVVTGAEWLAAVAAEMRRLGLDPAEPHRAAATVGVAR